MTVIGQSLIFSTTLRTEYGDLAEELVIHLAFADCGAHQDPGERDKHVTDNIHRGKRQKMNAEGNMMMKMRRGIRKPGELLTEPSFL